MDESSPMGVGYSFVVGDRVQKYGQGNALEVTYASEPGGDQTIRVAGDNDTWHAGHFQLAPVSPVHPLAPMHEKIRVLGYAVADLTSEKNQAYGSSFEKSGEFLRLLYPDGMKPEQYGDALLLVRIFDKQMRIATRKDAFGESPFKDIAGYGLMGAAKDDKP